MREVASGNSHSETPNAHLQPPGLLKPYSTPPHLSAYGLVASEVLNVRAAPGEDVYWVGGVSGVGSGEYRGVCWGRELLVVDKVGSDIEIEMAYGRCMDGVRTVCAPPYEVVQRPLLVITRIDVFAMVVLVYVSSSRPDITASIRTRTHLRTLFASTTLPRLPSTQWENVSPRRHFPQLAAQ
ncbi:hypothetical protein K439DRAFT_1617343 [Ramaria rubella]|nr:hypothetical protein K439DRAFT_1617343 [Ramaria rubella]